ncbi:MAG TPA: hypothetical protein VHP83_00690 [Aggregatilineaceae bacterium]|nr:hypothetical protein [Aggregatilineaceae bacterium]
MKKTTVLILIALASLLTGVFPLAAQGNETFTSQLGLTTFDYPTGWVVDESDMPGMIMIGSSQAALDEYGNRAEIPDGEIVVTMLEPQAISALAFSFEAGMSLDEAFDVLKTVSAGQLSDSEAHVFGGYPALVASDDAGIGMAVLLDLDGDLMIAIAQAGKGGLQNQQQAWFALLNTLQYAKPDGMIPYTVAGNGMGLEFPAGWQMLDFAGMIRLTNQIDMAAYDEPLLPGSVKISILVPTLAKLYTMPLGEMLSPEKIFPQYASSYINEENFTLGTVESLTVAGYAAEQATFTSDLCDGYVILVHFDDENAALVSIAAASGESAQAREAAAPILDSLIYTPEE